MCWRRNFRASQVEGGPDGKTLLSVRWRGKGDGLAETGGGKGVEQAELLQCRAEEATGKRKEKDGLEKMTQLD
jgi:hypothetical protein